MKRNEIIAPSDPGDQSEVADWIEARIVANELGYMSRAKVTKELKGLFLEDVPDVAVELILQEIERRSIVCGASYPFTREESGIRFISGKKAVPYLFMLCLSVSSDFRLKQRQKETDLFFDTVVVDALKKYLGAGSCALRFGFPASGNRPKRLRDAVVWLAGQLRLSLGPGAPQGLSGDGGLDVVAWHPFTDKRTAFVTMLAQCTVQRDWFSKAKDLIEDPWRNWISFGKNPHLVLAVPFVIPTSFPKWDGLRHLVHTVLDRLRICKLLEAGELSLQQKTARWTAVEIGSMATAE